MTNKQLPISLRPATSEDVSFIFSSWLKSYRGSPFARNVANEIYFNEHHLLIEKLVRENEVIIACNNEDENQIYGYIVAGKTESIFTLHYIYVKHNFRSMGIGAALLNHFEHDASVASIYTHYTRLCDKLGPKYNFIHHPYILITNEASNE